MPLLDVVRSFLRNLPETHPSGEPATGERRPGLLVAFSGGPDSTCLLWALTTLRRELGVEIRAAHLDHGLDPGSARRARDAVRIARQLGAPLELSRLRRPRSRGTSSEAWAREHRYRFLEESRRQLGLSWIATGHHAHDQAETVLLRWLYGSGLEGLGGMAPVHERIVRPLLGVRREEIEQTLAAAGLQPVDDPTNRDPKQPRGRIRSYLLPALEHGAPCEAGEPSPPDLVDRLGDLAARCRSFRRRGRALAVSALDLRSLAARGARLDRTALERFPEPLMPLALSTLDHLAGRPYPTAASARSELLRQLGRGAAAGTGTGSVGCDAGGGWRWQADSRSLYLLPPRAPVGRFTYTLQTTVGACPREIGPLNLLIEPIERRLRLRTGVVESWMFRGFPDRAALCPPAEPRRIEVRNRRPGDRLRPLGSAHTRSLKDLLVDRRIPRHSRDRIPLLVLDGLIAWVPGVTIDDRFRIPAGQDPQRQLHGKPPDDRVWIAELLPLPDPPLSDSAP
ncbi:MAG: tRNA lysidine(34) synthetase TilS [Holophagales bacterium]|nr:tRNA lysidine(34) synthetase TilS [Holophagales bacterium]